MTSATLIQEKIYKGYYQSAKRLGKNFKVYRSATSLNPLEETNYIFSTLVGIDHDYTYKKPSKYSDKTYQALADGRILQPFDYLVSDDANFEESIFFISGMMALVPITVQNCNYTIDITRPKTTTKGFNQDNYSGYTQDNVDIVYQNCPCTLIEYRLGEISPAKLPAGVKQPSFKVFLPYLGNTDIKIGDFLENEKKERFSIISNELTDMGWRMTAIRIGN